MNIPPPANAQRGFGLMEVLITVLIMAIGLLGMASLQLNSLRNNTSAYERSQANILAYDIIDRMRANRDVARANGYNTDIGDTVTTVDCLGTGANCSPQDLAGFDLSQWKAEVANLLPNGDAAITTDGDVITVTIQWEDNRSAATAEDRVVSFSLNTVL